MRTEAKMSETPRGGEKESSKKRELEEFVFRCCCCGVVALNNIYYYLLSCTIFLLLVRERVYKVKIPLIIYNRVCWHYWFMLERKSSVFIVPNQLDAQTKPNTRTHTRIDTSATRTTDFNLVHQLSYVMIGLVLVHNWTMNTFPFPLNYRTGWVIKFPNCGHIRDTNFFNCLFVSNRRANSSTQQWCYIR